MEKTNREKALEQIPRLRPLDDILMRMLFKDNTELAEYVLRTILNKPDLQITQLETQRDLKRIGGSRSLCLDVYAVDSANKIYDIEVQKDSSGASPRRARYHASAMDIENLKPGFDFEQLPEAYTIFITEEDIYSKGCPLYDIERINIHTGNPFDDGEHILFVNGQYAGNDAIGDLMHDFRCNNASDMKNPLFAKGMRYLKESKEGVEKMCDVMKELVLENNIELIRNLMKNMKISAKQAMDALGIPAGEQELYAKSL